MKLEQPLINKLLAASLLVAVFLVFGNSLINGFVWDDKPIIVQREGFFEDWKNLGGLLFTGDKLDLTRESSDAYYRPLTYLTFFLDYHLWGHEPFWYHLENVLLHAVATLLIFTLALRILGCRALALFSALLFAVHPVNAEAVNFLAGGRNTLLCAVLTLGALVLLERSRGGGARWVIASLAVYSLALLSKEQAAVLPLFLAATTFLARTGDLKVDYRVLGGFFAVTVAYLVLRTAVLGFTFSGGGFQLSGLTLPSLYAYFRLMAYPGGLTVVHEVDALPPFSFEVAVALCGAGLLAHLSTAGKVPAPIRLGSLWLLLGFLPISHLIEIPSAPVAERYLYIPLIGLCLMVGHALRSLHAKRPAAGISLLLLLVAVLGVRTHQRNSIWRSDITLWTDVIRQSPDSATGHSNLGGSYLAAMDYDTAIEHYLTAVRLAPDSAEDHFNLGTAYKQKGITGKAIQHLEEAVRLNPDHARAHHNLGSAYRNAASYDEAIEHYRASLRLNPDSAQAHDNLGIAYRSKGDLARAVEQHLAALSLDPSSVAAHNNLAVTYMHMDRADKAIEHYLAALSLDPQNPVLHLNLSTAYEKEGLHEKAREHHSTYKGLLP